MQVIGEAPDVTGLTAQEAESVLSAAGFRMVVETTLRPPTSPRRGTPRGDLPGVPELPRVVRQRDVREGQVHVTCVIQTAFLQQ